MDFKDALKLFTPVNKQEKKDQKLILDYIDYFPGNMLVRDNNLAHFTSSALILNPQHDKVLMVYHRLRQTWSWTGGHCDGSDDFLEVAIKEAKEETGLTHLEPYSKDILSLDVFAVSGHLKKGEYVPAHLHFNVGYLLIASEDQALKVCEEENLAVEWVPINFINEDHFSTSDVILYQKLLCHVL